MESISYRWNRVVPVCISRSAATLAVALVVIGVMMAQSGSAFASDDVVSSCFGPAKCCPERVELSRDDLHVVQVGAVLVGISDIADKTSNWSADFYLYEQWTPAPGFVPQTELVNELERKSVQFDTTELRDDRCTRTRRVRSVLRSAMDLHTFPFDHQGLTLQLSDAEFTSSQVRYSDQAIAGLDDSVSQHLIAWKIESPLRYAHASRTFRWDPGAPEYDYATFSVTVSRQVSYHVSKYFLPLLLIVVVSFSVFWIDPEDLASAVQVGVTCLLAVVALQFAEASDLPSVSYLTIADRVYSASYVAIALAVLQSIYANRLVRAGQKKKALQADKWSRVAFPVGLISWLVVAIFRAYAGLGRGQPL